MLLVGKFQSPTSDTKVPNVFLEKILTFEANFKVSLSELWKIDIARIDIFTD